MGRLATTAIGGLTALAVLLLNRSARRSQGESTEVLVIHGGARVDTPALERGDRASVVLFLPLRSA